MPIALNALFIIAPFADEQLTAYSRAGGLIAHTLPFCGWSAPI